MTVQVPDLAAERAELAADLHDLVTHQLTAVTVQLAAARSGRAALSEPADSPVALARTVLDELTVDLRRLGRLLTRKRPAPFEPVPSLAALREQLGADSQADPRALDAVPAGVAVCAFRCVELVEAEASVRARAAAGALALDVTFPDAAVRDVLAARLRVRLEPCDGRLRMQTPTRWLIELPLRA